MTASAALARVEGMLHAKAHVSLFLDIDGTLLDIAPTPASIRIPPGLPDILSETSKRLSGALAIVTGRPIAEADEILYPMKFTAAGVHGAELRASPDGDVAPMAPAFDVGLWNDLRLLLSAMPGITIEDKGAAIAVHYRLAPQFEHQLRAGLATLAPKYPEQITLCEGRKVIEILPAGLSKATALQKITSLPRFAQRIPVMIGDDIADIGAFHAAESLGGIGLKVAGESFTEEEASFNSPSRVVEWLSGFNSQRR